jgi:glycosyltransferase involved in cell wall biosynthesis
MSQFAPQPLVSVVTPFFNTADYLEDCIKSVLAQSYDNWEYILVNNKSTDGSFEIAQRYAATDTRIRLVTQEVFLGQSENYNAALTHISPLSKYCKVVQADDLIYPNCLSELVRLAEANDNVGIVSSYSLEGIVVQNRGLPLETQVISGIEACRRNLLLNQHLFGTPTTILVRSSIVRERKPFYDPTSMMDDTEACYEILKQWDFGFVHQILSYCRLRTGSIRARLVAEGGNAIDDLVLVAKYGRAFLSPDEFNALSKKVRRLYMRFLAWSLLCFRSTRFWSYQRDGWQRIGLRVTPLSLLPFLVFEMGNKLLEPKLFIRWARNGFRSTRPNVEFNTRKT